jgi:hypothetical protein
VGLMFKNQSFRREPEPRSWPFMSAPTGHDLQVSLEGVGVPAHQEIEFKDGSRIWLARVMESGMPALFLRDLGDPATGVRIDLRRMIPEADTELPRTSTRDVAGYVHFALRQLFEGRDAFVEAAVRQVASA